jgi:hypothetical protein
MDAGLDATFSQRRHEITSVEPLLQQYREQMMA